MQRCAPLAAPRTASCASAGLLNLPRGPASFFGLSPTSLYGVQFADQLQRSCFSPSYVSSGTSELASIMEEASPKPYHYLQLHGKTQASEDLFFPLQPLGGRNTCRRGKAAVILWAKLFRSITLQGWSLLIRRNSGKTCETIWKQASRSSVNGKSTRTFYILERKCVMTPHVRCLTRLRRWMLWN